MNDSTYPSILLLVVAFAASGACNRNDAATTAPPMSSGAPVLPAALYNYADPALPAHFGVESERFHRQLSMMASDNTPADNPTTDAGATLGRVLFYDRNLSQNRTVSCASCHKAERGFSDDRVLSLGFLGGATKRHSMGLTNARFYALGRFFWDQRAATLEEQVLMPFQDEVEMGMTLVTLKARAKEADYYLPLFKAAFGDTEITTDRISRALAQFVRSMVSFNSKYDTGRAMVARRSEPFPNFTDVENRGKALFVTPPPMGGLGCFVCHQGEGFIAQKATSNGLDASTSADHGYGEVTGRAREDGTFKVPSLRNVALRAPYMHDGRFASLAEVVDHYSDHVERSPNLGPPFPFFSNSQGVVRLNIAPEDKKALIAFLTTLSDPTLSSDPKFSDPFPKVRR